MCDIKTGERGRDRKLMEKTGNVRKIQARAENKYN
jgi:hypothetical protein